MRREALRRCVTQEKVAGPPAPAWGRGRHAWKPKYPRPSSGAQRCPKPTLARAPSSPPAFLHEVSARTPPGRAGEGKGKPAGGLRRDVPAFTALLPLPHPEPLAEEEALSARRSAGCGAVGPRGVLVAGRRDLDGRQLQELLARGQDAGQVPGQPGLQALLLHVLHAAHLEAPASERGGRRAGPERAALGRALGLGHLQGGRLQVLQHVGRRHGGPWRPRSLGALRQPPRSPPLAAARSARSRWETLAARAARRASSSPRAPRGGRARGRRGRTFRCALPTAVGAGPPRPPPAAARPPSWGSRGAPACFSSALSRPACVFALAGLGGAGPQGAARQTLSGSRSADRAGEPAWRCREAESGREMGGERKREEARHWIKTKKEEGRAKREGRGGHFCPERACTGSDSQSNCTRNPSGRRDSTSE